MAGHGVLQLHRNGHVADLHRHHRDAPFTGLAGDLLAQPLIRRLPIRKQHRERRGADHLAQRGLGDPVDGFAVVGDGEGRGLGVVHFPEDDRIDIDRDGVLGQGLLGHDRGGLDPLVDDRHHVVDDREDDEQSGPLDPMEVAGPQDHEALPGVGHLQREGDDHGQQEEDAGEDRADPDRRSAQGQADDDEE